MRHPVVPEVVEREADAYIDWARGLAVAPTIVDLRRHLMDLAEAEMARFRSRLGPLSEEQTRVLEEFRVALLNKILHHPTLALKRAGSRPEGGETIALLREAFGLDAKEPDEGSGSGG